MNQCNFIGNLTKDVELSQTQSGLSVAKFTLAVNRRNGRNETDFINCVAWRELAENCAKYLEKGKKAFVSGELNIRTYDKIDGTKGYATEIQVRNVEFLSPKTEVDNNIANFKAIDDDLPF